MRYGKSNKIKTKLKRREKMTIEEILKKEEGQTFDRKSINIDPKALAARNRTCCGINHKSLS